MENISWLVLPLIGFTGGFASGFLGLGGGVVMLPLLTLLGGVPLKLATGTSLVIVLIAAATSTFSHYRAGMVDEKAGAVLGLAGIAGGLLGSFLSVPFSLVTLQIIYLFVVGLATAVLFIPLPIELETYAKGEFSKKSGMAIGFAVGCLTGLLGVGGGFIIVPLMTYCLGFPLRVAIGTSLLVILITSMGTFWPKFGVGHIDLTITLLVLCGSVSGALLGSYASRRTPVKFLRSALITILILIFIAFGYKTIFP